MKEVIDEYYPDYCHLLEAAYGKDMMSDGGSEAIDGMFEGISLEGKKALDIGSGLGGVPFYLAGKHSMKVRGLEINPWMIEEATARIPQELQDRVDFVLSTDNDHLPFEDASFDIVYSKGVLCHVEEKRGLFSECYRILKPGGVLIINDWLSTTKGKWGGYVQRLVELEGLSLYAETIDGYLECLESAKFQGIDVQNLSEKFAKYNEDIVRDLQTPERRAAFIDAFSEQLHEEAIEGYDAIAKAMHAKEGLVIQFTALKKPSRFLSN